MRSEESKQQNRDLTRLREKLTPRTWGAQPTADERKEYLQNTLARLDRFLAAKKIATSGRNSWRSYVLADAINEYLDNHEQTEDVTT